MTSALPSLRTTSPVTARKDVGRGNLNPGQLASITGGSVSLQDLQLANRLIAEVVGARTSKPQELTENLHSSVVKQSEPQGGFRSIFGRLVDRATKNVPNEVHAK